MKKINVSSSQLRNMLPPVPEDFMRRALYTIDMAPEKREEPIVKKKVSLAFVLAMMIILAITVAYAVASWQNTAENIAPMQAEKGYYETWTAEDKVMLVRLLHEAGELAEDQSVQRIFDEKISLDERARLADELMKAWTDGPIDTVTFDSILETLHGPISTWSMEDKVWYMELLEKAGMRTAEDMTYILPEGGEITEAEAVLMAKATFQNAYGVSAQELDTYQVEANFTVIEAVAGYEYYALGDRLWSIIINNSDAKGFFTVLYHADITNTGEVLAYTRVQDGKSEPRFLVPGAADMPEDEAVRIAAETLQNVYGVSADALDSYAVNADFWLVNREQDDDSLYTLGDRVWTVTLNGAGDQGAAGYRVEIRNDRKVLVHSLLD